MLFSRSIFPAAVAALFACSPLFAFQFPLSESAARSAYFLGQRRDNSTAEFLARYSKHLPPPKTGPYVSDVLFLTPFAQLVDYSSRQSIYSAQQAEAEGPKNHQSVEITVYVYFPSPSAFSPSPVRPFAPTPGDINPVQSWQSYKIRVFDASELRQPSSVSGQSQNRCSRTGCIRVGTAIHLTVPAEFFASDSATVEVATPDGQLLTADFSLSTLL